jgi:hypothetical protein
MVRARTPGAGGGFFWGGGRRAASSQASGPGGRRLARVLAAAPLAVGNTLNCKTSRVHSRTLSPSVTPSTRPLSHPPAVTPPANPTPGPNGNVAQIEGDFAHRNLLMALFYASYTSDLIQMRRRPEEFTKNFMNFMTPHHLLSFAWFTPWMVFMAPRGAEGAPIWNTVRVVLVRCARPTACVVCSACFGTGGGGAPSTDLL